MKITVTNLTPTKTYSYPEMLREIHVGNLYLISVKNSGGTSVDYLVMKFANSVAHYIDSQYGLSLLPILDNNQNAFSNIRRVSITELNVNVIENL